MISNDPSPLLGEDDRRHVWWRLIDEIGDALDTEGLPATDRGTLVALRQQARDRLAPETTYVPDYVPLEWTVDEPEGEPRSVLEDHAAERGRVYEIARGPGGLFQLEQYGVNYYALRDVVWGRNYGRKFPLVEDVERLTERELLGLHGIGPKRAAEIRAGIARYRAEATGAGAEPQPRQSTHTRSRAIANGPGGIAGLEKLGISPQTWWKLFKADLLLIEDVERADQAGELQTMKGIGPRVLKTIRAAIASVQVTS